jgi:formiminotetrahydrofolate cyclodeaminase
MKAAPTPPGNMSLPTPETSVSDWAAAIATPSAGPAGGASAALSAALAAALVEMVGGMTGARERYAAVHESAAGAKARAAALRQELLDLAARDAAVFAGLGRALALPRDTEAERAVREDAKQSVLREGARVQYEVLERVAEIGDLAAFLTDKGPAATMGDAATAGFLAAAAARSAYWAVRDNLQDAGDDPETKRLLGDALERLERAEAAEWRIRQLLNERVR